MKKLIVAILITFPMLSFATEQLTNKELVMQFYQMAFQEKKVKVAAETYLDKNYIQHNPYIATGRSALINGLSGWLASVPDATFEIVRVISEGDLVVLHVRQTNQGKETAMIDIFRVEQGEIVEHWDVVQQVPSKLAHENSMF